MICPFCQHSSSRVLESRSAEESASIRRRRECLKCARRFTTYERIEFVPLTVIKRSGRRDAFDRSKILRGVTIAVEKTAVTANQVELLVDDVETELQQKAGREVNSTEIGEMVLKRLKVLNEVAYVRFASVYRKFTGVADFVEELQQFNPTELDRRKLEELLRS
ncbi:MAG: transcriptional regulator NrdR [Gloeobacterales cyanobacterium]